MGVTSKSIELIEKVLSLIEVKEVMELGSQNLFDKHYENIKHDGQHSTQPFASDFYEEKGIKYNCIDLNGENSAYKFDLSKPIPFKEKFNLVTDFGTGEHCQNIYNVFKNIHNLLNERGIAIRENPKTGSWQEGGCNGRHGYNYMTMDIYKNLCELCGYKIITLEEHPAMGNNIDGWNVICIYQKTNDFEFISEKTFNQLNIPNK